MRDLTTDVKHKLQWTGTSWYCFMALLCPFFISTLIKDVDIWQGFWYVIITCSYIVLIAVKYCFSFCCNYKCQCCKRHWYFHFINYSSHLVINYPWQLTSCTNDFLLKICCTESTDRNPLGVADGGIRGFSLLAYWFVPLHSSLANVNGLKNTFRTRLLTFVWKEYLKVGGIP